MSRAAIIRKIYDETPKDYRLRSRGAHKVMLGERSGHRGLTTLESLSTLELERLAARYHTSRDRRHLRRDCVGIHTHDSAIGAERDRLTARRRRRLRGSQFALPARRALPIEDAAHVRAAASRLEQMRKRRTVTAAEYRAARARIDRAERRLGIRSRR